MFEVSIPDHIYQQARQAAEANHVTLAQFVAEAVQLHLEDTPESFTLSPEQVAKIRRGQAEIKAGKFLTFEQVNERSAASKAAWLQENPL